MRPRPIPGRWQKHPETVKCQHCDWGFFEVGDARCSGCGAPRDFKLPEAKLISVRSLRR